jgi:hypothetical protein
MREKKDLSRELLKEAERIDREDFALTDEEAEGRWVFVRARPPKEPSQIYSLRLPVSVVEQIRLLAASKGEAPTALLREWVLEHLDEEFKVRGKTQSRPAASRGEVKASRSKVAVARKKTAAEGKSARRSGKTTSSRERR